METPTQRSGLEETVPSTDSLQLIAENTNPDVDNGAPRLSDKDLCKCGNEKQVRSKMCRACWAEARAGHPRWRGSKTWVNSS